MGLSYVWVGVGGGVGVWLCVVLTALTSRGETAGAEALLGEMMLEW